VKRLKLTILAGILCISSVAAAAAPAVFAAREFILVGGTRAVIEGQQLILIGKDSKRRVAPPGYYDIRASDQSVFVEKDGVRIGESPKGLR
jgi:hypothetical protein